MRGPSHKPLLTQRTFTDAHETAQALGSGAVTALPGLAYGLGTVPQAMRVMSQAKHIGKVVISHRAAVGSEFRADASYIITGGFGGLGMLDRHPDVPQPARTGEFGTDLFGAGPTGCGELGDPGVPRGERVHICAIAARASSVLKSDLCKDGDVSAAYLDGEREGASVGERAGRCAVL